MDQSALAAMPHLKSAHKNLRKNQKREAENRRVVGKLEKLLRGPATAKTLPSLFKAIDKAAKRGIFSKGRGARIKSSISRRVK
jgi:ribosomal protein S20